MTKDELDKLEDHLRELIRHREGLGGFDANSEIILRILQMMLVLTLHLQDYETDTHNGSV